MVTGVSMSSRVCSRSAFRFVGMAMGAAVVSLPAHADQTCLANGKSFQLGQVACLTVAGSSHLARCDMVLNNTSWAKIQDNCPGLSTPVPPQDMRQQSSAQPHAEPNEPTEN